MAVPIQTHAQLSVSHCPDTETTAWFVVARDERGVRFQRDGEIFIDEESFVSPVLSNLNRYPTRLTIRNTMPPVRDTQTLHMCEVWIK